jgi:chorismate dehydratase
VNFVQDSRVRVAAIDFLNPAPLMWDFEYPPLNASLALRYKIERMFPSECATRLAEGTADIGLIPIASLATTPGLRILPGCTIASKGKVLRCRRYRQPHHRCLRAHPLPQMGQSGSSLFAACSRS